jgi:hypothetical protein
MPAAVGRTAARRVAFLIPALYTGKMTIHPLRKFFSLVFFYIMVIFGIFVLQFRNESSIVYFIDKIKIVLTEAKETSLKTRIEITALGMKISTNERHPVMLSVENERIPLVFESWVRISDRAAAFNFNNRVKLVLAFDPQTERVTLAGEIPEKTQLILPFQTMSGYSIVEQIPTRTVVASKTDTFSLVPGVTARQEIVIRADNPVVSYSPHTVRQVFTYDDSLDSALANETFYMDTVGAITDRLIEAYGAGKDHAGEQTVVSYIAAMGERNRYIQAVSDVPGSFKNSRSRTYLSAPYFDSLAAMDESLVTRSANLFSMMTYATQRGSLDFFTVQNLADYLLREPNAQSVVSFLSLPSRLEDFKPSVTEAAGILDTYASLITERPTLPDAVQRESHSYALLLEPALASCLEVVASACSIDGDILVVHASPEPDGRHGEPLPSVQAADIGAALINYGAATNRLALECTGYFIINSLCGDVSRFDLRTLGELYPRLVRSGAYYPRSMVLSSVRNRKVWAWSIAREFSYTTDDRGDVTLEIDFPADAGHYAIVKGVEPFGAIEIYGMGFRSDPKFEIYNSSGYVYDEDKKTLYLKVFHKTPRESVRLTYYAPSPVRIPPPARTEGPAEQAERPAEGPAAD